MEIDQFTVSGHTAGVTDLNRWQTDASQVVLPLGPHRRAAVVAPLTTRFFGANLLCRTTAGDLSAHRVCEDTCVVCAS